MTITSDTVRNERNGDGTVGPFPYTFKIFDDDEILVYVDGVLKTKTTHYTVSGSGQVAGGNVTFTVGSEPGVGVGNIVFISSMAYTQQTAYPANSPFPETDHEQAMDKVTRLVQQIKEKLGRAVLFTVDSLSNDLPIADPAASSVLQWNDDATGIENGPTATEVENAQGYAIDSAASAAAALVSEGAAAASAAAAAVSAIEATAVGHVNLIKNSGFQVMSRSDVLYDHLAGLVVNGDFEPDTSGWSAGNSASLLSAGSGAPGNCLKILENGAANPYAYQSDSAVEEFHLYQFRFYVKQGDESTYDAAVWDQTNSAWIVVTYGAPEATPAWVQHTITYVAPEGCEAVRLYLYQICANGAGTFIYFDSVENQEVLAGYEAVASTGLDGWLRSATIEIYREPLTQADSKGEFYALKCVTGSAYGVNGYPGTDVYTSAEWMNKVAGRTLTLTAWVHTWQADEVRIGMKDSVGAWSFSDYHTGGGTYEKLSVTHTVDQAATSFYAALPIVDSTGVTLRIQCPMMVYGSFSPEYVPSQDKYIRLETVLESVAFYAAAYSSSLTVLDLMVDSAGKIGKGVGSVEITALHTDSGSAGADCYSLFYGAGMGAYSGAVLSIAGIANNRVGMNTGRASLNNGELSVDLEASGAGTAGIYVHYTGVWVK